VADCFLDKSLLLLYFNVDAADIVVELSEKFGHYDDKKLYRFGMKSLLKKIECGGFQSLYIQELAFVHQKIMEISVEHFQKYSNISL